MASVHNVGCRTKKKAVGLSERGPRPAGNGSRVFRQTATNHAVDEKGRNFIASERHKNPTQLNGAEKTQVAESLGYDWNRFERQRHQRTDLQTQFDESTKKIEKFGGFSFLTEDRFGIFCTSEDFVTGSTWRSSSGGVQFTNEHPEPENEEEDDAEAAHNARFTGLRKARFFEGCSRADRAFDNPRLPMPHSAREARGGQSSESFFVREGSDSPQRDILHPAPRKLSGLTSLLSPSAPAKPRRLGSPNNGTKPASAPPRDPGTLPAVAQGSFGKAWDSSLPEEPLSIADSMSGFVTSCKQAGMNPVTTGIIRPKGNKLKLEYGCITDARAEAIIHTLRASSSDVKEASFQSNGLTEIGAKHLLSALPEDVEIVDLSENNLGHNDSWCHCFKKLLHLKSLNVSNSELGDNLCRTLCESIGACRQLVKLNLSGNHIYKAAGAIGTLIHASTTLEELDVHWNHVAGDAARDLVHGLLENGLSNFGCLSNVNLSYNPIGKGGADDTCKLLAQVFSETKILSHIDLCKCDLNARQCEILAEGLKDNVTLLGIHLGGNEAIVNPCGFIVPRAYNTGLHSGSQPKDLVNDVNPSSAKPGAGQQREIRGVQDAGSCWVCNRWTETRIVYDPGISGPETEDAWVYTSVDNFERATKLTKSDDSLMTYFMCPPGILRFVFQVGNKILASRTAPILHEVKPAIKLHRVMAPEEAEEDEDGNYISRDVEVSEVNTLVVFKRDLDASVCECSVPRRIGEVKFDRYDSTWKVDNSLFGPYEEFLERRAFCERCFEIDWKSCWISHLVADEADMAQVKDILRAHYAEIKVLYWSLCSVQQNIANNMGKKEKLAKASLTFGVTMNAYTHMLVQHQILSDELSIMDADAQFLSAAVPARDSHTWALSTHTGGHMVLRHGFFELLVRLALCKFRREDILPPEIPADPDAKTKTKAKSASHALELFLNKHIMYPHPPMKYNFNCVQWRVDVLHSEDVEIVLRKHLKTVIDPLFKAFSHTLPRSGHEHYDRYLLVEDWFAFLDCLHVWPCSGQLNLQNTWDRSWVWQISAMSHTDELTQAGHLRLSWPEFLEAIARLVGLLTARKNNPTSEEAEKIDYGLGYCSPSYAFCLESSQVGDKEVFSKLLDSFLAQPLLKQVLEDRVAEVASRSAEVKKNISGRWQIKVHRLAHCGEFAYEFATRSDGRVTGWARPMTESMPVASHKHDPVYRFDAIFSCDHETWEDNEFFTRLEDAKANLLRNGRVKDEAEWMQRMFVETSSGVTVAANLAAISQISQDKFPLSVKLAPSISLKGSLQGEFLYWMGYEKLFSCNYEGHDGNKLFMRLEVEKAKFIRIGRVVNESEWDHRVCAETANGSKIKAPFKDIPQDKFPVTVRLAGTSECYARIHHGGTLLSGEGSLIDHHMFQFQGMKEAAY